MNNSCFRGGLLVYYLLIACANCLKCRCATVDNKKPDHALGDRELFKQSFGTNRSFYTSEDAKSGLLRFRLGLGISISPRSLA